MSLFYRAAYRVGVTPWERAAEHAAAADHISALFDREQQGLEPPYGRALDVGCGGGTWAVELARRGWQVTGIDNVRAALERARQRASAAGVEVRFLHADVTALRAAGLEPGFRLVWDFGTVHGLTPQQRQAAGREVTAVSAPDASIVMLAWAPGRRGPLPRGMNRAEIEAMYAGWRVIDEEPFDATGLPKPLRGVDPRAYRLRRE